MRQRTLARLNALGFFTPLVAFALVGIEQFLAQPDRFRRDLDQLIVVDIGQRLFQRHANRRGQPGPVVALSLAWVRILVIFLPLSTLTSRSLPRVCSPTIMPRYTFQPGSIIIGPRSSRFHSAYATASPRSLEISTPLRRPTISPRYAP